MPALPLIQTVRRALFPQLAMGFNFLKKKAKTDSLNERQSWHKPFSELCKNDACFASLVILNSNELGGR